MNLSLKIDILHNNSPAFDLCPKKIIRQKMNVLRFPYFCRHTIVVGGTEYSTLLLLIQRRLQSPGI